MSKRVPHDPLGGHVRLYWSLLDTPAYIALTYSAKALYVDLRRKLGATNNGNINAVLSELKHRGWRSSATLAKALAELEAVGLIAKTRQGGIAAMSKTCSLYRFTDLPVHDHPKQGVSACKETHDYRHFQTLGHAHAVLRELRQQKNRKVQKAKLTASETEAMTAFTASETEADGERQLQKLKLAKGAADDATH